MPRGDDPEEDWPDTNVPSGLPWGAVVGHPPSVTQGPWSETADVMLAPAQANKEQARRAAARWQDDDGTRYGFG